MIAFLIVSIVLALCLAFTIAHIITLHEGLAGCRKKIEKLQSTKSKLIHRGINEREKNFDLVNQLEDAQNAYYSLEVGLDEVQDSYEQQFLTFREHISSLETRLVAMQELIAEHGPEIEKHREQCLPFVEDYLRQ